MDKLDINQLTSVVRQRLADYQADAYMDQVLTAVLEADKTVEQSKKDLAAIQKLVAEQTAKFVDYDKAIAKREADHKDRLAKLDADAAKRIEAREATHTKTLERLDVEAEASRAGLEAELRKVQAEYTKLTADKAELVKQVEETRGLVASLLQTKIAAENEVKKIKADLAKIKAGIPA